MKENNVKSNKKSKLNKDKNNKTHSKIFNYEGLKTVVSKYNLQKNENKNMNTNPITLQNYNLDINIKEDGNDEKRKTISNLKIINTNIDIILTGMKDNLQNNANNREKKLIKIDNFIQLIDNKDNSLSSSDNNINIEKDSLNKTFHNMSITNFNFEIINKKDYLIDINKLNEEEKIKIKYIFNNNLNSLGINDIIDKIYDFKTKYEELKNSNNLILKKNIIDENYFKEIIKKRYEFNKIENNNEIIKNEINSLLESLTKSYYYSDLLLNRYYNKLKGIDSNIQKNIDDLLN